MTKDDNKRIERAAQAVFDWHLERAEGAYSAQSVRSDLAKAHPCIQPRSEDDCRDSQIAIWRRVLRRAEDIAFAEGWYLTRVPGGRPDDRILTQKPAEINRGIEKLLEHAWSRMVTATGALERAMTSVNAFKPSDIPQLSQAVRSLDGAMANIESVSPKIYARRVKLDEAKKDCVRGEHLVTVRRSEVCVDESDRVSLT